MKICRSFSLPKKNPLITAVVVNISSFSRFMSCFVIVLTPSSPVRTKMSPLDETSMANASLMNLLHMKRNSFLECLHAYETQTTLLLILLRYRTLAISLTYSSVKLYILYTHICIVYQIVIFCRLSLIYRYLSSSSQSILWVYPSLLIFSICPASTTTIESSTGLNAISVGHSS